MPSTLVHVGFAGLIGALLLDDYFDVRAIALVLLVAAIPDLDTLIGLWLLDGAHRTLLHNLLLPTGFLLAGIVDTQFRTDSFIHGTFGDRGVRIYFVSIVGSWITAHVLLDTFYNGTNLLWPFYDQFIDLSGKMYYSNQDGFVQTFIDLERNADTGTVQVTEENVRGSSQEYHYYTGFDPGPAYPEDVERRYSLSETGELFLVMITGYLLTIYRLWETRKRDE